LPTAQAMGLIKGTLIDNLIWSSEPENYIRSSEVSLYVVGLTSLLEQGWQL